ncbi:Reticulocyte-binding protein 2 a-like protein [Emericellopsis cladophorae]|uniref:Reticulocyte-binding protein 2 a-like protein n=1 Tax=Emericellopsis cladophorae TaxID=2686198 RepID=A0A9P9XWF0_9HYPO|nr:Reticulocyte-binding protein 2 a-like protein [Emericellopsis cladophorae]KAI6779096.1 Reticulocyte-binding protein 2 a-like protein [Emericellopsis cladophorae]
MGLHVCHDIFDSQARKQYLDKAPDANPFGNDDAPARFQDFDVPTKQLTQWVMIFPERIRERMDEQRDIDQTTWRIEPYGWDSEDRTYFVLDDNRVYRLTEPPPAPPSTSIKRSKKAFRSGRRSNKRRRTQTNAELDAELDEMSEQEQPQKDHDSAKAPEDGLGGMVWECLAVTLEEARLLIEGFRKSRDENEKILRKQLEQHLLPILEKQEESRQRRIAQRERELLTMAKLANAKRSSRLASKLEQQKHEEKVREEQQQQQKAALTRLHEEEARLKRETERDFRMASRGQRLREREARRIQHVEELANLSEDSKCQENGQSRLSERRRQAEIERAQQALKDLDDEDDEWTFDCVCGLYGKVDDGTHSVACESCNVWQHSRCLGLSEDEVESPESHFVCAACKRRQVEASNATPHTTIKLKVKRDQNTSNTQLHMVDDLRNNDTGDSTQSHAMYDAN